MHSFLLENLTFLSMDKPAAKNVSIVEGLFSELLPTRVLLM